MTVSDEDGGSSTTSADITVNTNPEFMETASYTFDADLNEASNPLNTDFGSSVSTTASGVANLGDAWVMNGNKNTTIEADGLSGSFRNNDVSGDIWFKVDTGSMADGDKYYLFETGGDGRGMTLWMERVGTEYFLRLHVQPYDSNSVYHESAKVDLSTNITSEIGSYIQAVWTIDKDATNGSATLYVNGEERETHNGRMNEWSGGNTTGIGTNTSSVSTAGDFSGISNFKGEIAQVNLYGSTVLSETAVKASYLEVMGLTDPVSELDYGLGGSAKIISSDLPLRDLDSADFAGGTIVVEITNAQSGDVLSFSGALPSFASDNGSTASSLSYNLNSSANASNVEAFLQSISFASSGTLLGTRNISFTVSDGDGGSANIFAAVNVNEANVAPVLSSGPFDLGSTNEDSTSSSINVGTVLGAAITDSNAADSKGIAISSVSGNGTWQYSLSSGGGWQNINLSGGALHLGENDSLRYIPDSENGETASFNFVAWDQTNSVSAGSTASIPVFAVGGSYSSNTEVANLTVSDVNDAPDLEALTPTLSFDANNASQPLSPSAFPATVDSNSLALGKAWNFTGSRVTANNFNGYNGNDASFEIWAKIDSSLGDGDYMIFETGATTHGTAIWINKSGSIYTLEAFTRYNTSSEYRLSYELDGQESDFMQIGLAIDDAGSNGAIRLFLNGHEVDSETNINVNNWAGGNGTTIGGVPSGNSHALVGESGLSLQNFRGQISQINFYNSTLSEANFASLYSVDLAAVDEDIDTLANDGESVSVLFGPHFSDIDTGHSFNGIVVSDNNADTSEGSWEYSTDSGSSWHNIGTASTGSALVLNSSSLLRFNPALNYNGSPGLLAVHAIDSSYSGSFTNSGTQERINLSSLDETSAISSRGMRLATIVNPVDDPSVISGDTSGAVDEGDVGDPAVTASGSLSISDVDDGDDPSFPDVSSTVGNNGYGNFEMSSGTWTYTLDQSAVQDLYDGEKVYDTYTFTASDGNSQEVSIEITGTNDTPSLSISAPASVDELSDASAQDLAAITGNLTVQDLDLGDTLTASIVSGGTVALSGGGSVPAAVVTAMGAAANLTFDGTVSSDGTSQSIGYTYDPGAADLDFIPAGETLTITYEVLINDGLADSSTQDLIITVNGTNDAPVFSIDNTIDVSDLSSWTSDDNKPTNVNTETPNWNVSGNSVTQTRNSHPAVLYSDFELFGDYQGEFTFSVPDDSDNDFVGFVLGYDPDGVNGDSDGFILVDWNRESENHSEMGLSITGTAISYVQGSNIEGGDYWTHTGSVVEHTRGDNHGSADFAVGVDYTVSFEVSGDTLTVSINGVEEFSVSAADLGLSSLPEGRFGFYNFANMDTTYTAGNFQYNSDKGFADFTESGSPVQIAPTLAVEDIDSADFENGTLTVEITSGTVSSEDVLSYGSFDISGFATFDAVNSTDQLLIFNLTSSADSSDIAALGQAITYENTSDFPDTGTRTVSFTLVDGDGGDDTDIQEVDISIYAVNDAPTVSVATDIFTTNEEATVSITGVSIDDIDAGTENVQLSLSVLSGNIEIADPAGGTASGSSVVISGTLTQINNSLASFDYTPDIDFSGSMALQIEVSDLGNTGSGGALTATGFLTVQVDPVIDVTIPSTETTNEDNAVGFEISADDSNENLTQIVFTGVANGTLSGNGISDDGGGQYTWTSDATTPAPVDFASETINSHGSDQDIDSSAYSISSDGNGINLTGNTWKNIDFNYTITNDTILEFEFRSDSEPELSMIMFDNDGNWDSDSSNPYFVVHGSQDLTHLSYGNDYNNYDGSGNWQKYRIRVGDHTSGDFSQLVFVNDDDASGEKGNSSFRNVVVYEEDAVSNLTFTFTPDEDHDSDVTFNASVSTYDSGVVNTRAQDITIEITPVNDDPVATDDTGAVDEDATLNILEANGVIQGSVADSDVDGGTLEVDAIRTGTEAGTGTSGTVGDALVGTYGTLTIESDGSYVYVADQAAADALATDEEAVETFTYTIRDNNGGEDSAELRITVTGTNDAATVSSANVIEDETDTPVTSSGTLTASDVDNEDNKFIPQTNFAGTTGTFSIDEDGNWSYTANSAFDYLNSGTFVSEIFNVQSVDGTGSTVSIRINGTNDPADVSSDDVHVDETDTAITTGGTLTATDVDNPDNTFTAQTNVAGSHGTFSIDENGTWSYTANSAFNYLASGESVSDTFNVESIDGTGSTVTITINGTNDEAVFSVETDDSDEESLNETNSGLAVSGTLTITDLDVTDTTSVTVSGVSESGDVSGIANSTLLNMMSVEGGVILDNTETQDQFQWDFNSNGEAFNYLKDGESLELEYTISSSSNDGLMNVEYINTTGTEPGNNTDNWKAIWDALDLGADPESGPVAGYTVANYFTDTETVFDYHTSGGNRFGVNNSLSSINSDGPGGGGAATSSSDYSVRTNTYLKFETGGTYTIAMGSDDGRRIELTEGDSGSAAGYDGFLSRSGQTNGDFAVNDTVIGFSGGTGHAITLGTFTVNAGDILRLDAFYYENFGGDSGEISIAQGSHSSFSTSNFQLLKNGIHGISLGSSFEQVNQDITSSSTTVSITINGTNDAPVAVADSASLTELVDDVATTNDVSGSFISNDTDPDDSRSNLSVVEVSTVSETDTSGTINGLYGILTWTVDSIGNGSYTYELNDAHPDVQALIDGTTLRDVFNYKINDNHQNGADLDSVTDGTLTITINGANDTLVAQNNTAAVTEDGSVSDTGNLILDNDGDGVDTDVDAVDLNITQIEHGSSTDSSGSIDGDYGTLVWDPDSGEYTYNLSNTADAVQNLSAGETLTDTFTYTIHNGFVSGDGLMDVQYIRTDGPNPGNNTANWKALWDALDGGAGPTGTVAGYDVAENRSDTETSFDYYSSGSGNFGVNRTLDSINSDGPGGGGVNVNTSNYSIRMGTYLAFNVGGTYTIAMGSDDGRRIELTAVSASGYTGFTSRGDQANGSFSPGDTVIGYSGGTGHNQTVGTFTVAAGDILRLDAFYYEGGGGDSGEISIANGEFSSFTGTSDFKLLQDGEMGIAVSSENNFALAPIGFSATETDTATLTITVTGANDAPVVSSTTATGINETTDASDITEDITVEFTDVDLTDTGHVATITGATTSGVDGALSLNTTQLIALIDVNSTTKNSGSTSGSADLTFTASSTDFDYLSKDQTVTITYTISVSDGDVSGTNTFDVDITGTNDAVRVTAETKVAGSVTEIGDNLAGENGTLHTDNGSFAIADVDLADVQEVLLIDSQTNRAGGVLLGTFTPSIGDQTTGDGVGQINWDFEVEDADIDLLQAGEIVEQTYTVRVSDQQGSVVDQDIVVTITGMNDVPEISIELGDSAAETIIETDSTLTVSGTLSVEDVDLKDSVSFVKLNTITKSGALSGLTLSDAELIDMFEVSGAISNTGTAGTLNWTFDSNGESFDYLTNTDSLVLTYTVQVEDSQRTTAIQNVVITISGTNDVPTASGLFDTITEDDTSLERNLLENAVELDFAETLRVENAVVTVIGPSKGPVSFTIDPSGVLTLDPAQFGYLADDQQLTVIITYDIVDSSGVGAGDGDNEPERTQNVYTIVVGGEFDPQGNSSNVVPQAQAGPAPASEGVNSTPSSVTPFRGNSLQFLSGGSSLQFQEEFLGNDSLNVVSGIFDDRVDLESEVADTGNVEQEVKDKEVYDKNQLPQEDLRFIEDLMNVEEEEEESTEDDKLSFESSDESVKELALMNVEEEEVLDQDDLDRKVNLEDTLIGDFDCFKSE